MPEQQVRDLLARGVEAFAVCLLHSYRNAIGRAQDFEFHLQNSLLLLWEAPHRNWAGAPRATLVAATVTDCSFTSCGSYEGNLRAIKATESVPERSTRPCSISLKAIRLVRN